MIDWMVAGCAALMWRVVVAGRQARPGRPRSGRRGVLLGVWRMCMAQKRKNHLTVVSSKSGADTENRTRDLTLTKGALYQLSHISTQKYSLAMTYSHTIVRCTTIGVTAFHFCVRNGDRWDYSTMVARQICI